MYCFAQWLFVQSPKFQQKPNMNGEQNLRICNTEHASVLQSWAQELLFSTNSQPLFPLPSANVYLFPNASSCMTNEFKVF